MKKISALTLTIVSALLTLTAVPFGSKLTAAASGGEDTGYYGSVTDKEGNDISKANDYQYKNKNNPVNDNLNTKNGVCFMGVFYHKLLI